MTSQHRNSCWNINSVNSSKCSPGSELTSLIFNYTSDSASPAIFFFDFATNLNTINPHSQRCSLFCCPILVRREIGCEKTHSVQQKQKIFNPEELFMMRKMCRSSWSFLSSRATLGEGKSKNMFRRGRFVCYVTRNLRNKRESVKKTTKICY